VGPGGRRRDRGGAVADVLLRRRPGRLTGHAEHRNRHHTEWRPWPDSFACSRSR
jgi:hypothetical protein